MCIICLLRWIPGQRAQPPGACHLPPVGLRLDYPLAEKDSAVLGLVLVEDEEVGAALDEAVQRATVFFVTEEQILWLKVAGDEVRHALFEAGHRGTANAGSFFR